MSEMIQLDDFRSRKIKRSNPVYFQREELNRILSLYSRQVAVGEWKDYALDHKPGGAIFSIFRSTHEVPVYAISKVPVGPKEVEYSLFNGGRRLVRKRKLEDLLSYLEKKIKPSS